MVFLIWVWSTVHAATLAILPFDNHTGNPEHDALGTGVSVMLMSDLGAVKSLQLVERSRLNDVLAELELGRSDVVDPKTAAKAGKVVGADWILTGALMAVEPNLRIDARIVEVQSGKVLGTGTAKGPIDAFFEVEKDLALTVTDKLGVAVSAREAAKVGRVATESFDAFRAWSEGLDAIDRGSVEEARQRFAAALRFDSGFSAATDALDSVKASLERSETVREEAFDAAVAELNTLVEAHRKGQGDLDALRAMLQKLNMQMGTKKAPVQQKLASLIIDIGLDESVKLYDGPAAQSINEFATFYMVQSSAVLKDRERVLTWAQTFLDRYPNSNMYTGVKVQLDLLIDEIEKERKALESGVLETIQVKQRLEMYNERCENEIDPRQRGRDCRALLGVLVKAPKVERWNVDRVIAGARDAGDLALARDAVAKLRGRIESPSEIRSLEERVAEFEKQWNELPEAEKAFRTAIADKDRSVDHHLRPFLYTGAYERGLALARDIPDAKERAQMEWRFLEALGRVEDMKRIHEAVMQQDDPFIAEHSRAGDIGELERDAKEAARAQAESLLDMAGELQREGLKREAAELHDRVVRDHLGDGYSTKASILLRAGSAWTQVYEADAPAKARAYYERVIAEYPDTPEGRAAKTTIRWMP